MVVGHATSTIAILPSNGDGTFQPAPTFTAADVVWIGAADFNGDGKADLVSSIGVALGKGDGTFQAIINSSSLDIVNVGGTAVGDFNGDGKVDVIAVDQVNRGVAVLLGDGTGKLGAATRFSTATAFYAGYLAVADLNGDHKLDVVAFDAIGNTFSVLLGNGNGTFQAAVNHPCQPARSAAAVAAIS